MEKAYRVKKEAEFQKVFHQGESKANRQFVVYVLKKPSQAHFRVGISVGKKIGNAVMRNRIKRRIRQALLEMKEDIQSDVDFIVIARKPTANMSMSEVKQSLQHVFRLSHLFNEKNQDN